MRVCEVLTYLLSMGANPVQWWRVFIVTAIEVEEQVQVRRLQDYNEVVQ